MTPPQRDRTDEEAEALLAIEREVASEHGVAPADTHLRYADRAHEAFLRVQQELDAGLLVVGERGTGTIAGLLTGGSEPGRAVRRSRASVLVVRDG